MDLQYNGNGQQVLVTWNGDEDRLLEVQRYCSCGTCQGAKADGAVGYLTGSTSDGNGFSAAIFSEEKYQAAVFAFGGDA